MGGTDPFQNISVTCIPRDQVTALLFHGFQVGIQRIIFHHQDCFFLKNLLDQYILSFCTQTDDHHMALQSGNSHSPPSVPEDLQNG